jgi:predicted dehydrogenase
MDKIKLCFLGCGNICNKHANTIKKLSLDTEISFASRSIEKAQILSKKFNGKYSFGSYESAIQSPDINTIIITTPPSNHYDLAWNAIKNGKHVIIEKPPVNSSKELIELGILADQQHVKLLVAENYFYRPVRSELKKIISQNLIGQPIFVNINATKIQKNIGDWREDPHTALHGALFEGGIHWINFINNMGFKITDAIGFLPNKSVDMEKSFQATFQTKENVIINLFYSWEVKRSINGLSIAKIYGSEGSIAFEINGLFILVKGKRRKIVIPKIYHITGFSPMFNDFFHAILSRGDAAFTWKMAVQDLELIEKLYHSSKNNLINK